MIKNKGKATATRTTPTQADFDFWFASKHSADTYGLEVTFGCGDDGRNNRIRYRRINSQVKSWAASMPSRSFVKLNLAVTTLKGKAPTDDQLYYTIFNPPAGG